MLSARSTVFSMCISTSLVIGLLAVICPQARAQSQGPEETKARFRQAIGTTWSDDMLPAFSESPRWYRIPGWMAGSWRTYKQTTTSNVDLRTGQEQITTPVDSTGGDYDNGWGNQEDALGHVWYQRPRCSHIDTQYGGETWHTIQFFQDLEADASSMTSRERQIRVVTDTASNQITRLYESMVVLHFTPVQDGVYRMNTTETTYEADGTPISRSAMVQMFRRTAPFAPDPSKAAIFKQFLQSNHMDSLIPQSMTASSAPSPPVSSSQVGSQPAAYSTPVSHGNSPTSNTSAANSQSTKHYREGSQLYDKSLYDQAIKELDQAIAENPKYAEAYLKRAECNQALGNQQQSVDLLRKAISDFQQAASLYDKAGQKDTANKARKDIQTLSDFVKAHSND